MKFLNMNENAVSPIVATLVLIVVAVVGAVAVGTIMGTFSSDVSEQVNTGDVSGTASSEILIVGSTTVQPASEALAKAYMKEHKGVKITVQGGGSGAGVAAAGQGIADLGSASRALKSEETNQWPDLQAAQIGGSGVAIVVSKGAPITGVTKEGLRNLYLNTSTVDSATVGVPTGTTIIGNDTVITAADGTTLNITVYQRAEASGTEETVAKEYLGKIDGKESFDSTKAAGANGNAGVAAEIAKGSATDVRLGFIDFGYVDTTKVDVLTVDGKTCSKDTIKATLKGTPDSDTKSYVTNLARPLNYVINGQPSSVVKNYIEFCQSPAGAAIIESDEVGMFGLLSFTSA